MRKRGVTYRGRGMRDGDRGKWKTGERKGIIKKKRKRDRPTGRYLAGTAKHFDTSSCSAPRR